MVTDQLLERMLRMTSRLRGATVLTFCYNSWLPQKQGNTFKWVLILLLGWLYKSCCGSCLFHNRAFFFVCLILVASCSRIMFLFHCICFFKCSFPESLQEDKLTCNEFICVPNMCMYNTVDLSGRGSYIYI